MIVSLIVLTESPVIWSDLSLILFLIVVDTNSLTIGLAPFPTMVSVAVLARELLISFALDLATSAVDY